MLLDKLVASSGVIRRKDRCCQLAHRKLENVEKVVEAASDPERLCPDRLFPERLWWKGQAIERLVPLVGGGRDEDEYSVLS